MKAVDTNVLVYAGTRPGPHHGAARAVLTSLAEGSEPWALPWPCLYEFLRVTTHPRVFHPPLRMMDAFAFVSRLLESPTLVLLSETSRHVETLEAVLTRSGVTGNLVHDAHIVALCLEHGVSELLTADRDFARFDELRVANPFVAS